jgi:hypothetical protein
MTTSIIRKGNNNTCKLKFDNKNKKMAYFTFESLEKTEIVDHFFSTRLGGVSRDYLT